MGDGPGGIDKVPSSWTLRGWSPPWTRATVTLHGLKSPSMWMYDSTTYRNHDKNIRVSNCVMGIQVPLLVIDQRRVSVMSTLFSNRRVHTLNVTMTVSL